MSKNHTKEESQDNDEQLNHHLDVRSLETNSAANSLSRRSFLGRAGASTVAVAAASVGLPSILSENAEGQFAEQTARSDRAFQIRLNAATMESKVHIPPRSTMATRRDMPTSSATFPRVYPTTASVKSTRRRTRPC